MRQLHYVILVSLLAASSLAEAQKNCSVFTPEDVEELINNETLTVVVDYSLCQSVALTSGTVLVNYTCDGTSCINNAGGALVDVKCVDGEWKLAVYNDRLTSDRLGFLRQRKPADLSCGGECVDAETFDSYPMNPPDNLAYNDTTHCLRKYCTHRFCGHVARAIPARPSLCVYTAHQSSKDCARTAGFNARMRNKDSARATHAIIMRSLFRFLFTLSLSYTKYILVGSKIFLCVHSGLSGQMLAAKDLTLWLNPTCLSSKMLHKTIDRFPVFSFMC